MHLPSSLFPSIDLTYIEDKYSGLSTQALFNALNAIKANEVDSMSSSGYTETKVNPLYFGYTCSIAIQELGL